jgi:hydrogenase maturation protein HypF
VYGLAGELSLAGWVCNNAQGVLLEVEGRGDRVDAFAQRLVQSPPPHALITGVVRTDLPAAGLEGFHIRASQGEGPKTALVLPDLATCSDCLREVTDPADRRYRYPFTNCTHCGPRFSIILALPYDRHHTTMRRFRMCPRCQAEYDDPLDRRFHAQPNACADCGPQLQLWDGRGRTLAERDPALREAAAALLDGAVVAVKGLGGFQLMVDASEAAAVARLRRRKRRGDKPFALMAPDLAAVHRVCRVNDDDVRLLTSSAAPIVLLPKRRDPELRVDEAVAPDSPDLGVMLPYTPLHHLLLAELDRRHPIVVATSGNLADEPICTDEREALDHLAGVADRFLVHDRPIARHVDDSVVRPMAGRGVVIRRARGYAPMPVALPVDGAGVVAVGGHLKSAVAVAQGGRIFLGQHIGDLDSPSALTTFEQVAGDLTELFGIDPGAIACDGHPDYRSTRLAESLAARRGLEPTRVQHHLAHVLGCLLDNELTAGPALGIAWDGTGYGDDGTVWGGEFLRLGGGGDWQRVAHLRPFRLPGGEVAVREPRRSALGLLFELTGDSLAEAYGELAPVRAFQASELRLLLAALRRGLNAPVTSSAGRLFDAVAGLLGLHLRSSFEGQAAMALESLVEAKSDAGAYPLPLRRSDAGNGRAAAQGVWILDWGPLAEAVLQDIAAGRARSLVATRFHNGLVEGMVSVAQQVGEERVCLTGGCFQNRYLTERAVDRLSQAGHRPLLHEVVPPNDGGLAVGQVAAVAWGMGWLGKG